MGNNYFTTSTEQSIVYYNTITGSYDRQIVYETKIHKPLSKLVENVIHKFKFYNYENTYADLKHEAIVFLHERLYNYTQEKGKAFSYFTIITRNFLIAKSKELQQLTMQNDPLEEIDDRRDVISEVMLDDHRESLKDFISEWSTWGIENIDILFEKQRDRKIANAIFILFSECGGIESFNKKSLYILIREHADVKTQYITKIVNRLREMFKEMYWVYTKYGIIDWGEFAAKYENIDKENV